MEGLRLCLLTINHSCSILQQLIPSHVYLNHDHTYCCFDPDKMANPPTICESDVKCNSSSCEREIVRAENKEAVLLELAITPTEHLQTEYLTCVQTESPLWYEVRVRTDFKCRRLLCQNSKTDALLKSVLYPAL